MALYTFGSTQDGTAYSFPLLWVGYRPRYFWTFPAISLPFILFLNRLDCKRIRCRIKRFYSLFRILGNNIRSLFVNFLLALNVYSKVEVSIPFCLSRRFPPDFFECYSKVGLWLLLVHDPYREDLCLIEFYCYRRSEHLRRTFHTT